MKKKPLIAIPSFPGSNGEVDNQRVLKRTGFDSFVFRWNDSLEKLRYVDGYFFGAGFSYEDRGRSGMVAARDPLFDFIRQEAEKGKVVIGNCNGAQVLIESGLIPLGDGLRMCLARNAIRKESSWESPGFLNEWIWMKPTCKKNRCATSNWEGAMHIPIAHGEGRFVTEDKDLIQELEKNDQIAFRYCDKKGNLSADTPVTPNGSTGGIAGICNKEGNVVAIMPHPERTELGDRYFVSLRQWIEQSSVKKADIKKPTKKALKLNPRTPMNIEIFIDTIITNNEERTVEQAARRIATSLRVKQFRYIGLTSDNSKELLSSLSFFNPHKERAYIRMHGNFFRWNADQKKPESVSMPLINGIALIRRDKPDTVAAHLGKDVETGMCYDCRDVDEQQLCSSDVSEVFCNPHSSSLEKLS